MDLFLSLFLHSFVCVAELHNNCVCRKSETCPSFTDELIIIHRHICSERDLLPLKKFTSLRSRADWKRSRLWVCETTRQTVSLSHCSKRKTKVSLSAETAVWAHMPRDKAQIYVPYTHFFLCPCVFRILTHLFPISLVHLSECICLSVCLNISVMTAHRIQVKSIQTLEAYKGQPINRAILRLKEGEMKANGT